MLSHLILITTLSIRYCCYPRYKGKDIESQIGRYAQDHISNKWYSSNSKPGDLAPESVTLMRWSIPLAPDLNTLEVMLEIKH